MLGGWLKRLGLALAVTILPAIALAQTAIYVDLAKETTATVGTGTLTVNGAVAGYLTLEDAGVTDGVTVSYGIVDGSNREAGRGVYSTATNQLTRCVGGCTAVVGGVYQATAISLSGSAQVGITAISTDFDDVWTGISALDLDFTDDATTAGLAITDGETLSILGDSAGIDTAGAANSLTISFDAAEAESGLEAVLDVADLQGFSAVLTEAEAAAAYQPLDADLTAIAALTTTAAGRSILTFVDPNVDAVIGWDDSAAALEALTAGEILAVIGDIALGTNTSGDYVATVADGTGIDGTATGEGSTYTPTFDATELTGTTTFGAGAAIVVAADLQATDDVLIADDIDFGSGDVQIAYSANNLTFTGLTGATFDFGTTDFAAFVVTNTSTDNGPGLELYGNSASPAPNDFVGYVSMYGEDSAGNKTEYGGFSTFLEDATDSTEDSGFTLSWLSNGTAVWVQGTGAGNAFTPKASAGISLGNTDAKWGSLFLDSAGVINFNSGDVTITHSANDLAFTGVTGDYSFDDTVGITGSLTASVDVTATTGDVTAGDDLIATDDVLLSDAGVINFNAGDCTLTEGTNTLTLAGTCTLVTEVVTPDGDNTRDLGSGAATWATFHATSWEVGNATDTTIARSGAGTLTVESVGIVRGATGGTDNSILRADGTGGTLLQNSVLTIADTSGAISGAASGFSIEFFGASGTDTTLTAPSAGDLNIEGNRIYRAGGTDVALADGGTGASLADPGADRILWWDESDNAVELTSLSALTTEAAPASGDFLVMVDASGALLKVDWASLPGGAGGCADAATCTYTYTSDGATGPNLILNHETTTPANDDVVALLNAQGEDSASNDQTWSTIRTEISDVTSTSEDSRLEFDIFSAGSASTVLQLGPAIETYLAVGTRQLYLEYDDDGANEVQLYMFVDSASPAAEDYVGGIFMAGRDSGTNATNYGQIYTAIVDPTNASEDSRMEFLTFSGGSLLTALTLGLNAGEHRFNFGSADYPGLSLYNTSAATGGPSLILNHDSASPLAGDEIGAINFYGDDSAGNSTLFGQVKTTTTDPTNGSEDSKLDFSVMAGGSPLTALTLGNGAAPSGFYAGNYFQAGSARTLETVNVSDAAQGAIVSIYQNSSSPATGDYYGQIVLLGKDSGGNVVDYNYISGRLVDPTNGSEDTAFESWIYAAGTSVQALQLGDVGFIRFHENDTNGANYVELIAPASLSANRQCVLQDSGPPIPDSCVGDGSDAGAGGGIGNVVEDLTPQLGGDLDLLGQTLFDSTMTVEATFSAFENGFVVTGANNADDPFLSIQSTGEGIGGPILEFFHDSADPADGDTLARIDVYGGADDEKVGHIILELDDGATTTEDTRWRFTLRSAGADLEALTLGGDPSGIGGTHSFDLGSGNFSFLTISNTSASDGGPGLLLYGDSATPAVDDFSGYIAFYGNDAAGNPHAYAKILSRTVDTTNGSEDGSMWLQVSSGGSDLTALTLGTTDVQGLYAHVFDFGAANFPELVIQGTDAAGGGPSFMAYSNSATPAADDYLGGIAAVGEDSAGNATWAGAFELFWGDPTNGSEDSYAGISLLSGGSAYRALTLVSDYPTFLTTAAGSELILEQTEAGDAGPGFTTYHNSASEADNDVIGYLRFNANNDTEAYNYGRIAVTALDITADTEDSSMAFQVSSAGSNLVALTLKGDGNPHLLNVGATDFGSLDIIGSSDSNGPGINFLHEPPASGQANNDTTGYIGFYGEDSGGNQHSYGGVTYLVSDVTNGSEDSRAVFGISAGGSGVNALQLGDVGFIRFHENDTNGANYVELIAPASLSANRQCVLQDSGPPIPDSCVGDGSDAGAAGGIGNVVEDTTPQLGGALDLNTFWLFDSSQTTEALIIAQENGFFVSGATDAANTALGIIDTSDGASGPRLYFRHDSASPADGDIAGRIEVEGGADDEEIGSIALEIDDGATTTEDTRWRFTIRQAGSDLEAMALGTSNSTLSAATSHDFNFGSGDTPKLTLTSISAGTSGPKIALYANSATPAAADALGGIDYWGEDSAGNAEFYGGIYSSIIDPTSTSEDSNQTFVIATGGSLLTALTLGTTVTPGGLYGHVLDFGSGASYYPALWVKSTDNAEGSPNIGFWKETSSPAASDALGFLSWWSRDSAGNFQDYGSIVAYIADTTSGSEDSLIEFYLQSGGSSLTALALGATTGINQPLSAIFDFGPADYPGLQLQNTSAATGGPMLTIYHNSASAADGDDLHHYAIYGEDDAGNQQFYGQMLWDAVDTGSGSEDGSLTVTLVSAGASLNALALDPTSGYFFTTPSDAGAGFATWFTQSDTSANGPEIGLYHATSSPADNDEAGQITFYTDDDGGGGDPSFLAAQILATGTDVSNGTEDGQLQLSLKNGGADLAVLTLTSSAAGALSATFGAAMPIVPGSDGTADMGTASLGWRDIFITSDIEFNGSTDTTLTASAAGELTLEGDAVKHAGKQMMYIPAGAMKNSALSPASCGDTYDSGTNDVTIVVCAFDTGATEENAEFGISMPKGWNESTITAQFIWTNTGGSAAQTVQWKIACTGFGDDDALNTAYPADVTVSDTFTATNDLTVTSESGNITVQNAAENDFVMCRIGRDTSVDNLAGDALLVGVRLFWTDNASTLAE